MEQKRTLLIVAAVGIFLLVVLGAALILNSATSAAAKTEIDGSAVASVTDDWLLPDEKTLDTVSSQDYAIFDNDNLGLADSDSSTTNVQDSLLNDYDSNGLVTPATTTITTTGSQDGTKTSSTLTTTVTPSTPTTTVQITQNSYSTQQTPPVTVITPKPAVQQKSTPAASETKQQAPKKSTAPQKNFWVQVGSFNKKSGADTTRTSLSAQGIQSEIFTYTADNGTTGFRVRVGPYQTRSEAEYWMKLVEEKTGTKGFITETK